MILFLIFIINTIKMYKIKSVFKGNLLLIFMLLIYSVNFAQDMVDDIDWEDEFYDFGTIGGITIFGERSQDFAPDSIEANVLAVLNGSLSNRKYFIENDLLENAGFRRTGNVRYRRTGGKEKAISILHGVANALSFGIVPLTSFFEVDFERLPEGIYYSFKTIINASELNKISPVVISVMEIEYMLQIEFCNGILFSNNKNYYTEGKIKDFEMLILELPEFPENMRQLKERYLNIELPKIKNSLERHNNPSENYLRAMENLGDLFKKN